MFTPLSRWKYSGMFGAMFILAGGCAVARKVEASSDRPENTDQGTRRWSFDADQPGGVASGWKVRETNPTKAPATWEIVADATGPSAPNAFALTRSDNYDGTFNLAIAEGSLFEDLDLTVQVKAVEGTEDQGGGPIWRCRDENNYFICRFNPLEGNYRLYKVVEGRRRQLDSVKIVTEAGKWYTIRVTMVGARISCYLNGRQLLRAVDDTFGKGGMIGLWTKADAVTSFDDLIVNPLK